MIKRTAYLSLSVVALLVGIWIGTLPLASAENGKATASIEGWRKGVGWGWIWGARDEVGALNAMTNETVRDAMRLAQNGKIYDLGITYGRNSYKWPGHSPAEIITLRSPEGVKRQKDFPAHDNPARTAWHSCALFINDNVATASYPCRLRS